jgi:RimJ/RimL family protein N-acetyltransferase
MNTPVHLRPFREADLELFSRFFTDPEVGGPFEWAGFRSFESLRRRWNEDGLLETSPRWLVIADDDDTAIGWVNWRDDERSGSNVFEIGVLIVPEMRGRGAGTAAQTQLVDYLFDTTPAHRIWAMTEVDNIGEQRALERSGFRREGRLRGTHFRGGEWRDSFAYGVVRGDLDPGSESDQMLGADASE